MTARAEIEDMLDEAAWRARVESSLCRGNDILGELELVRGPHLPSAAALLAASERKRDEPQPDAYDALPVIPRWLESMLVVLTTVALVCGAVWLLQA